MILSDLFNGFIDDLHKKGRKRTTILKHEDNIKFTIEPVLGQREFKRLRLVDVSSVIQKASPRGVSTARSTVITLARIMHYARALGHRLPFDPYEIEMPAAQRLREPAVLSDDEIAKIRQVLSAESMVFSKHLCERDREKSLFSLIRTRCLFEFLLHTGLRISEALSVDRDQINMDDPEIRVRNIKTGTWASVYFFGAEQSIKNYLAMRKDNNPALFISWSGKRLGLETAHSGLMRIKKRIGLKKNINHRIFRTTFVTRLLLNGCDPKETQKLARHTSLQTTLGYYYVVDDKRLKPKHKDIIGKL